MKVTIVDKLSEDRENLLTFISKYCDTKQIHADIHEYINGETFLKEYQKDPSPLVFLDINPGGKLDGIEITRQLHLHNRFCLVILSADTGDRAAEAYVVRAFDYLLKPYDYNRFRQSMDSCLLLLPISADASSYITVKESRRQVRVLLTDIIYTDYYNHYIQIHTGSRTIRSYMSFSEFSPMLLKHSCFLSCYRNCIINMDRVEQLDNNDFLMDTGERIPMSRRLRSALKQAYTDYQFIKKNSSHPVTLQP